MGTAYFNGRIFDGITFHEKRALLVNEGVVAGMVSETDIPSSYTGIDIKGNLLAPAFIDLQIYGGNGKMFSQETTIDSIKATYEYCKSGGASSFMITIATNSIEKFVEGMAIVREYWKQGGKGLLGLHMEGPYLNPAKKGAHVESYLKRPTIEEVTMLLEKGSDVLKMMTIAPECCDAAVINLLQNNGVLVSAGHTNATYDVASKAFNDGIPVATHLYNAMSSLLHRAPGVVGAIFDHPSVMSSVVCDGIHADFAAVRIAKNIMKERLFYITDAVAETTHGDYVHLFKGDHFALPDGTLSGSSLTMMKCVQNGVEKLGISLEESLRMASRYPASLLAGPVRGVFQPGATAEVVVFNDTFEVLDL
jgi:N-acetylglucosamine-6-phosphate deacetylase